MAKDKLTKAQQDSLLWLVDMHHKHPGNGAGFNPPSRAAAAAFRRMEGRGHVQINRMAPTHFRYAITQAGFEALRASGRAMLAAAGGKTG